eukprot:466084_1
MKHSRNQPTNDSTTSITTTNSNYSLSQLPFYIQNFLAQTTEIVDIDSTLFHIRCALSKGDKNTAKYVINSGCAPRLIKLLKSSGSLQIHALSCITKISTFQDPNLTTQILRRNAINTLITLQSNPSKSIKQLAIYCIGNIAAIDQTYRDLCLDNSVLLPYKSEINVKLCDSLQKLLLFRTISWTLSQFTKTSGIKWKHFTVLIQLTQILLNIQPKYKFDSDYKYNLLFFLYFVYKQKNGYYVNC